MLDRRPQTQRAHCDSDPACSFCPSCYPRVFETCSESQLRGHHDTKRPDKCEEADYTQSLQAAASASRLRSGLRTSSLVGLATELGGQPLPPAPPPAELRRIARAAFAAAAERRRAARVAASASVPLQAAATREESRALAAARKMVRYVAVPRLREFILHNALCEWPSTMVPRFNSPANVSAVEGRIDFADYAARRGWEYAVRSQYLSSGPVSGSGGEPKVLVHYEGTWLNGRMHGLGTCTYVVGGKYSGRYTGEFDSDAKNGAGAFQFPDQVPLFVNVLSVCCCANFVLELQTNFCRLGAHVRV